MKKWHLFASFAVAVLIATFGMGAPDARAEGPRIKVAAFTPERGVGVTHVIKPWMEAVQAEVGDSAELKGYWGGTLGRSPVKQYELVKNGVADVNWVSTGYTGGQFPELGVLELPFLARNGLEASLAAWELYERGLLSGFDDVHLVGIFISAPSLIFTRVPINNLADLKNKKLRSVGPVHSQWLASIGATAQNLTPSQYNEALNRKSIDGVIQGWTGMNTFKSFSLVTHAYDIPLGVIPFLLVMNKKTWEGLPPNVQAAVTKHGGEVVARNGGNAYDSAAIKIKDRIAAEGKLTVLKVDPNDLQRYISDAKAVHDAWIEKTPNGRAVYDAVVEILADIRAGKKS